MLIRFLPGFRIFCLCWLVLWGVRPGDAASENRTIDLFAYSLVRPPIVISLADLPDEFSKFAYSLFLVSPSDQPYPLNAIVGVPEADAQNWQALAERLGWTRLNEGGFQFFASPSLGLESGDPVLGQLLEKVQMTEPASVDGGLAPGWKQVLLNISRNASAKDALAIDLMSVAQEEVESYRTFVQWWLDEMTAIQTIRWSYRASPGEGLFNLDILTEPGTREYRLLNDGPHSNLELLDYVPANADKITFLRLNSERATNFLNYLYKETNLVTGERFQEIRKSLDKLDAGFFDLWDGEWVLWSPANSVNRILMTNGRFVSSDLSDLFEMFEGLAEAAPELAIQLDENNSVVGFTRIRSLDWETKQPDGISLKRAWYFGITNGHLIVSDSESLMTDLVFKLNSRRSEYAPARNLVENLRNEAFVTFEKGRLSGSFRLNEGQMRLKQIGTVDGLEWMLTQMFKIGGF